MSNKWHLVALAVVLAVIAGIAGLMWGAAQVYVTDEEGAKMGYPVQVK